MNQPSEILDRVRPHDLDAEKGVLGSILLEPDVLDDIGSQLRPEHFYADANRKIYRHLLSMHDSGTPLDIGLLSSRIKEAGEWEAIGGAAYIGEVAQASVLGANATFHAGLIIRAAKLRALIDASTETLQAAYAGVDDPNDILNRAESAMAAIETGGGSRDPVSAWDAVAGTMRYIDAVQARGESAGVMTGLLDFDRSHGGLFAGELIMLAARPGVGKSALAMQWAYHSASRGRGVYFASLEMSHVELTARLMCSESGVNSRRIRGGSLDKQDRAKLAEVSGVIAAMNLHTHDQPQLTTYDIRRAARRLLKDGVDLVIVDYLQLLKPDNPRDPVHEQLGAMTRQLKILARELDVPVLVLCQLNREADKGQARLSHLKGSGAIEQDADVVMLLDRPGTGADKGNASGEAILVVEKNRNGTPGAYKLEWDGARTRYSGANEQQPHDAFDAF